MEGGGRRRDTNVHFRKGCTHMLMRSSAGWVGMGISSASSSSSSLAVGIQRERRPLSTRDDAAKARMSARRAGNEYGFLGAM